MYIDPESEAAGLLQHLYLTGNIPLSTIARNMNRAGLRSPTGYWWHTRSVLSALVSLGLVSRVDLARKLDARSRQRLGEYQPCDTDFAG
jgi:hypothetical protein